MKNFFTGDLVGFESPDEGYVYGIVTDVEEYGLVVDSLDNPWESFQVPKNKAKYIQPIYMDDETADRLARYEITAPEVIGSAIPPERVRTMGRYTLSIDDLLAVLKKANGMPICQFREEWFFPICETLHFSFSYGNVGLSDAGDSGYRFLPSEGFFVWDAIDSVDNLHADEKNDYSEIIEMLQTAKKNLLLPVPEREYDEGIKEHYIKCFDKNKMLEEATEDELRLFIRYVNELCEKGNQTALYAKAYGCYGGNRAFPCDWITSRDCLLKLMEIDENPFLANTLGYIYYYGRCTDGKPEYDKAFKYYSIGAAGYVYESRYKLSDMFRHGYGVPKNHKTAASLIWELYDKNIDYIFKGKFDTKFADIALRVGNLFRDGIDCAVSPDDAYFYYLQADFAIKMRMLEDDHYGDAKVADGIRKAIEEILPQILYAKPKKTLQASSIEDIIRCRHQKNRLLALKIKKLKGGEYSLQFRILPKEDENYPPKLFVTEPAAHFCGLLDTITAKTVHCTKIKISGKVLKDDTATVIFDSVSADGLYFCGKPVAEIYCQNYLIRLPTEKKNSTFHFASVVFQQGGRVYDYLCDIPDVTVGDKVIVETERGEAKVEVVRIFDKSPTETALPISRYKSIKKKL